MAIKEDDLITKAKAGDIGAYGELINQYKEYLYKTAYSYMKNEENTLDVVSETVYEGLISIKKLKDLNYFKTWLTRILINTAIDALVRRNKTVSMEEMQMEYKRVGMSLEEKIDLNNAMDQLGEKYKKLIIMRYFQGMSIKEMALVLSAPEGTIKGTLSRAKFKLRKILKEDYLSE